MRVDDGIVNRVGDEPSPDVLPKRRAIRPHEAALSGERLDHALALQLRVRFCDRVAIDAELFGEGADARQRIARSYGTRRRGRLDLIDELQVDGFRRLEVEVKQHGQPSLARDEVSEIWLNGPTVIGRYDSRVGARAESLYVRRISRGPCVRGSRRNGEEMRARGPQALASTTSSRWSGP